MLRLEDGGGAGDVFRQDNGAAADQDEVCVSVRDLHGVDAVLDHGAHDGKSLVGNLPGDAGSPFGVAEVGQAAADGDVGCSHDVAAEDYGLLRYLVADAVRSDGHAAVGPDADDGATAEADGDDVRHSEVRADTADGDGDAGFTGKAVLNHAEIGCCAADIDDDGVLQVGKIAGAADGIGRTAGNRQNRVAASMFHCHERAVVLTEIDVCVRDAFILQTLGKAVRESLRHLPERCI